MNLWADLKTQNHLWECARTEIVHPEPQTNLIDLTFPFQLIAIGDELQGVCFIGRVNVIDVDVQVIRRVQEVVRQQRALAMVQRKVQLGRDKCPAFAVRRSNAAASRWAHVQGVGGSCSGGITKQSASCWEDAVCCPLLIPHVTYRVCCLWDHKMGPCLRTLEEVWRQNNEWGKQPQIS